MPARRAIRAMMVVMRCTLAAVVAALAVSASPARVAAQIYRYTDERGTAHYVDGVQNVPERHRATATPLPYRNEPVPGPPAPSEVPAADVATIRFTPGQRIVTDAHVNDSTPVQLLVDTGADRTLISPRALVAAGVSLTRGVAMQKVRGVTGSLDVPRVVIDSLTVGGARVTGMSVLALELEQPGYDGLLGRDFLDQFSVSIDPGRGVVTIRPR
jgi:hypothetical protein